MCRRPALTRLRVDEKSDRVQPRGGAERLNWSYGPHSDRGFPPRPATEPSCPRRRLPYRLGNYSAGPSRRQNRSKGPASIYSDPSRVASQLVQAATRIRKSTN
jgi:hypothetical protein